MSAIRYLCCIAAGSLSGCVTAEQSAWVSGVSPRAAREIGPVVAAYSSGQVAYYSLEPDGITAWMRPGHDPKFGNNGVGERPFHAYVVRRIRGQWKIVDEHVLVF